jgi:hypothetical protein
MGRRTELNNMVSRVWLDYVERKFALVGVTKLIPAQSVLEVAYRRICRVLRVQGAVNKALELARAEEFAVPAGLAQTLRERLTGDKQAVAWDTMLAQIAQENLVTGNGEKTPT